MSIEFADHQEKFGKIFEKFEFWPAIQDGELIVDLGCGGGVLTRELAHRYPGTSFLGIDVNKELVDIAIQRAANLSLKNIKFLPRNASDGGGLNVAPADGILCRFLMEDLSDPGFTISSMYDGLKPGAWACTFERLNSYSKVYPQSDAIDQVWADIYKYFESEFHAHPQVTTELPRLFENAGFKDVRSSGYTAIVSKNNSGETFNWYLKVASGLIENMSPKLVDKRFSNESVIKRALKDYLSMQGSENSFILEVAICISGRK